jgi:hypothetical protein
MGKDGGRESARARERERERVCVRNDTAVPGFALHENACWQEQVLPVELALLQLCCSVAALLQLCRHTLVFAISSHYHFRASCRMCVCVSECV